MENFVSIRQEFLDKLKDKLKKEVEKQQALIEEVEAFSDLDFEKNLAAQVVKNSPWLLNSALKPAQTPSFGGLTGEFTGTSAQAQNKELQRCSSSIE